MSATVGFAFVFSVCALSARELYQRAPGWLRRVRLWCDLYRAGACTCRECRGPSLRTVAS